MPADTHTHAYSCMHATSHYAIHNIAQHNTTQHNTTQHNTTQHNTTQHNTTQHNTTQHNTTQHNHNKVQTQTQAQAKAQHNTEPACKCTHRKSKHTHTRVHTHSTDTRVHLHLHTICCKQVPLFSRLIFTGTITNISMPPTFPTVTNALALWVPCPGRWQDNCWQIRCRGRFWYGNPSLLTDKGAVKLIVRGNC